VGAALVDILQVLMAQEVLAEVVLVSILREAQPQEPQILVVAVEVAARV
jgi:hypothetical protein